MTTSIVDLRSDTVTRPAPGMREAMAAAEVGDDVYGEDPAVNALEARVAAMFGHEAAMFAPTGTMANQISLQLLVPRGGELLCDADAHVVTFEVGAAAAVGGISTRTWPALGERLEVEAVTAMIRPEGGYHQVATRAIAVEQTHNRGGGGVIPLSVLRALRAEADDAGIALHCDGARIWNAHIASGVPLETYGRLFDTLSVCLSKGLGAPAGSLVVSSRERIEQARTIRKRLGGGMRQVGVLAAAGDYALTHHLARLADDHARARRLAEGLAPCGVVDPARVATNIVVLDLAGERGLVSAPQASPAKAPLDAPSLAAAAAGQGVRMSVLGPRAVRLVTHLDVDDAGIDRAIDVLSGILRGA